MSTLATSGPVPLHPARAGLQIPWQPPLAGAETAAVLRAPGRSRSTLHDRADGLDSADLDTRVGAASLTRGYEGTVSRAHATVTAVLGDGGLVAEDPPPDWRPVAGDSAVRDG